MSGNLAEFLKVLTIVVTWSTCILVGRRYMLSIDDSREESNESNSDAPEVSTETITLHLANHSQAQVAPEDFDSPAVNKN